MNVSNAGGHVRRAVAQRRTSWSTSASLAMISSSWIPEEGEQTTDWFSAPTSGCARGEACGWVLKRTSSRRMSASVMASVMMRWRWRAGRPIAISSASESCDGPTEPQRARAPRYVSGRRRGTHSTRAVKPLEHGPCCSRSRCCRARPVVLTPPFSQHRNEHDQRTRARASEGRRRGTEEGGREQGREGWNE